MPRTAHRAAVRTSPLRTLLFRTAVATAAAATVATSAVSATPAGAAGTFSTVVFPDQSHSTVYSFVNSATRSIDLTMYELTDTTAESDLVAAAHRGVTVRVILDAAQRGTNNTAYSTLSKGGVGVTWSSSSFVYTHQKTLTVDGATSLIMTGNLDSRYYSSDRDYGVYDSDTNDVAAIEAVFNADYAKTSITPGDGDDLVWSPTDSQTRLLALINGAQHSLLVEELEFGDTTLVDAITAAAQRGVAVEVVGMNNSSYSTDFSQVAAAGGRIVLYSSTTGLYIHAKAIVADYGTATAKVFAGSENFSDNSLNHNRELGLIVSDPGVLSTINSTITTDFTNGTPYQP